MSSTAAPGSAATTTLASPPPVISVDEVVAFFLNYRAGSVSSQETHSASPAAEIAERVQALLASQSTDDGRKSRGANKKKTTPSTSPTPTIDSLVISDCELLADALW